MPFYNFNILAISQALSTEINRRAQYCWPRDSGGYFLSLCDIAYTTIARAVVFRILASLIILAASIEGETISGEFTKLHAA